MKCYCITHFEHRNNTKSKVKHHREYLPSAHILYANLDHASDVISMFKMNYTIGFYEMSVRYIVCLNQSNP